MKFNRVESDNYTNLGDLIINKNNLPLHLPGAASTILKNNKLIKLYAYGVDEYPLNMSYNSWVELVNKKMTLGKFFVEYHLYDVLEN